MNKRIQKECKYHGLTTFRQTISNKEKYRCCACQTESVKRRRYKLKELSVQYKGGKCEICGYNKCISALDFHHKDSSVKEFGISASGETRSFERIKKELDKCILVCANCHREIHSNGE